MSRKTDIFRCAALLATMLCVLASFSHFHSSASAKSAVVPVETAVSLAIQLPKSTPLKRAAQPLQAKDLPSAPLQTAQAQTLATAPMSGLSDQSIFLVQDAQRYEPPQVWWEQPSPPTPPVPAASPSVSPESTPSPSPSAKPKIAYLTFDDGPVIKGKRPSNTTENLLAILAKRKIHATFFLLGRNVITYPDLARSIADQGHVLGNHTWSHVDASKVTGGDFAWQVQATNNTIYEVTGVRPKLFRPPYGRKLDSSQWGALGRCGLKACWWNVDTRDWAGATDKEILDKVAEAIKTDRGGLVILFHDHSFSALEETIDLLQQNGYIFDTLDNKK